MDSYYESMFCKDSTYLEDAQITSDAICPGNDVLDELYLSSDR